MSWWLIVVFFTLIYICRAKNLLFVVYCNVLKIKAISYFLIVKRLIIKVLSTFSKNGEKTFQNFRVFFCTFFKIFYNLLIFREKKFFKN